MASQNAVLRMLEQGYREGQVSRREFVRAMAAATALVAFAGSTTSALAAAERRADQLDAATPRYGGTLKVAITGQPDQLDPATSNDYASFQIIDNIFDNLVAMDPRGYFKPELATSWRQLDSHTWEFHLVRNAVFHNGEPFTAHDVAYTINRILDPKTASAEVTAFNVISKVEIVDDYTVRFHLKHPHASFLTDLSNGAYIQNEKAVTTLDPHRNPIGTGPFKFKEWVTNDHVTLVRNPHYWQAGRPYVDSIIFRGAPVDETRMAALQAGEFNWIDAVPLEDVPKLRQGKNPLYLTSNNAGNPDFLGLVVTQPPFNNTKLRQAIAWAIDKRAILDIAYFGVGEVGSQEVGSGSRYYTTNDPYRHGPDLNKAQQLMKEAGYASGLKIEYLGLPQYPELLKTGEVLREQLAQIGITMSITQMEVTVWVKRLVQRQYQITSIYAAGTVDPDTFYNSELTSYGLYNFSGYKNAHLDALILQAGQTTDPNQRKALYAQVRSIVWDEAPYIFVHYETLNYAMSPQIHGTQILPTLQLFFKDVWIG